MQYMFSHLFAFSFLPGVLAGLINGKYRHRVAGLAWLLPVVVLIYKLMVFPTTVFENHWLRAFHYYFSSEFSVPEFHSYRELFGMMTPNSDILRGVAQLHVTGTFYAAVGYSLAAFSAPYIRNRLQGTEGNASAMEA
jgi:hypothetical protein